jgi:hypothetical protein
MCSCDFIASDDGWFGTTLEFKVCVFVSRKAWSNTRKLRLASMRASLGQQPHVAACTHKRPAPAAAIRPL